MEEPQPTKTPATTAPEAAGATEMEKTGKQPSTAEKRAEGAKIREKRAFTATVVTFALTALLIFMAVWTLITGNEDKNGIIAGAMVVATGAIQFYFGTKNGGNN